MSRFLIGLMISFGLIAGGAGVATSAPVANVTTQSLAGQTNTMLPMSQVALPLSSQSNFVSSTATQAVNPCRVPGMSRACKAAMKWIVSKHPAVKQWTKKGFKYFKAKVLAIWHTVPGWIRGIITGELVIRFIEWLWDQLT